jgi:hypothetical protein
MNALAPLIAISSSWFDVVCRVAATKFGLDGDRLCRSTAERSGDMEQGLVGFFLSSFPVGGGAETSAAL